MSSYAIETNGLTMRFGEVLAVDAVSLCVRARSEQPGLHSYVLVVLTGVAGLAAIFYWWRTADQTR